MHQAWFWLGVAAIIVSSFLAYWPAIHGKFIWDDEMLVDNNVLLRAPDGLLRMWFSTEPADYWPMTNSSFWLEWQLWNANPTGYHITNLLLHIASAFLLWAILKKLSLPGAFLAALLFAVHPLNVESVAWISQRKNTLSMFFYLLSILSYVQAELAPRPENRTWLPGVNRWYWLSLAAFLLAMLSKGAVAILPLLLLLLVWWMRKRITRADVLRTVPFFLIAAVLTVVNIWFQTHGVHEVIRNVTPTERVLGAGAVVWFYLFKSLLPIDLMFVYPQWHVQANAWVWWLPLCAAFLVTAVLWWQRNTRWGRPLFFVWMFFCVALVPVMGFTDVYYMKTSLVADHYAYFALPAVVALVAAAFSLAIYHLRGAFQMAMLALPILVVALFTAASFQQSRIYSDPTTLYLATLEKNPACSWAYNNLGVEQDKLGQTQNAISYFKQALNIEPEYPEALNNLGADLFATGRPQEAIELYRHALQIKSDFPAAETNWGNALLALGHPLEAIEHFQHAIELHSDYALAYYNLANAFLGLNQLDQAIENYQRAIRLYPEYTDAHYNLGLAYLRAGRPGDAVTQFENALRLNPASGRTHFNLAVALENLNRRSEAVAEYRQALQAARNEKQFEVADQIEKILAKFPSEQPDQPKQIVPKNSLPQAIPSSPQ